jgi:hypothetical protein
MKSGMRFLGACPSCNTTAPRITIKTVYRWTRGERDPVRMELQECANCRCKFLKRSEDQSNLYGDPQNAKWK